MKKIGCFFALFILTIQGMVAAEDMKYIDFVNSSTIKTESVAKTTTMEALQNKNYLCLEAEYRGYNSGLHIAFPVIGLAWKNLIPERNIGWKLHIQSSMSETPFNTGYVGFLSTGTETAVFDKLSFLGLGGGLRGHINDDWAVDLDFDYLILKNGATNSGFFGFDIGVLGVYKHELTPTLTLTSKVGPHYYNFDTATVGGVSGSLNNPISGFDLQLGIALEQKL